MRITDAAFDSYAGQLVLLLERFGVEMSTPAPGADARTFETIDGHLGYDLTGSLPDGRTPPLATIRVKELFVSIDDGALERTAYGFELIDRARGFRRAFHMHDTDWFQHQHLVVVHEHCEQPIGTVPCAHYEGTPVRDGFAGVLALLDTWAGEPPDCSVLRCLE